MTTIPEHVLGWAEAVVSVVDWPLWLRRTAIVLLPISVPMTLAVFALSLWCLGIVQIIHGVFVGIPNLWRDEP